MTALTPAERILKSLGIEDPGEIDLEAIAWTRGAVVEYRPLDRCEATIVGSKRKAVIAVNSRSPPERRRFSLGHEVLFRVANPGRQDRKRIRASKHALQQGRALAHRVVLRHSG